MRKLRDGLLVAVILCTTMLQAQDDEVRGKIIQDARVDTLYSVFLDAAASNPVMKAFRVEIFFESGAQSKTRAMEEKARFVERFPEIPCYVIFQQPYYKVRIGDCPTRMEAEYLLNRISSFYPDAFVVEDMVPIPDIPRD
ncbi:MAG: hypothetical protein Kow00127_19850 [Bacteroidales bacterium]